MGVFARRASGFARRKITTEPRVSRLIRCPKQALFSRETCKSQAEAAIFSLYETRPCIGAIALDDEQSLGFASVGVSARIRVVLSTDNFPPFRRVSGGKTRIRVATTDAKTFPPQCVSARNHSNVTWAWRRPKTLAGTAVHILGLVRGLQQTMTFSRVPSALLEWVSESAKNGHGPALTLSVGDSARTSVVLSTNESPLVRWESAASVSHPVYDCTSHKLPDLKPKHGAQPMYTDPIQWSRVRNRLLGGESLRSVSLSEHIARPTLRRILATAEPTNFPRSTTRRSPAIELYMADLERLFDESVRAMPGVPLAASQLHRQLEALGCPSSYRVVLYHVHRLHRQRMAVAVPNVWNRAEKLGDHEAARLLRQLIQPRRRFVLTDKVLEQHLTRLRAGSGGNIEPSGMSSWGRWLAGIERSTKDSTTQPADSPRRLLMEGLRTASRTLRKRVLCVLAYEDGFSIRLISQMTDVSRNSIRRYRDDFLEGGCSQLLLAYKARARKADDQAVKDAVFTLLHEPPSLSGINRTTWKMADVRAVLATRGFVLGADAIRAVIRAAGFRWKSAKVVLTSHDPEYRKKLAHIQDILASLGPEERFFSIDEFGPFAIKMKAGRALSPPDVQPTVPQWQKSKGRLILTAALELSTNQVTHFYSEAKNTKEMIRMATVLVEQYRSLSKLYISWDAASWHLSKELTEYVSGHNEAAAQNGEPELELAPLPASAQFLNVIESVFSGMARSIIHCSDYESKASAQVAMDQYFKERNEHFLAHPQRAGKKIWGKERVAADFCVSNNCKDPAFR